MADAWRVLGAAFSPIWGPAQRSDEREEWEDDGEPGGGCKAKRTAMLAKEPRCPYCLHIVLEGHPCDIWKCVVCNAVMQKRQQEEHLAGKRHKRIEGEEGEKREREKEELRWRGEVKLREEARRREEHKRSKVEMKLRERMEETGRVKVELRKIEVRVTDAGAELQRKQQEAEERRDEERKAEERAMLQRKLQKRGEIHRLEEEKKHRQGKMEELKKQEEAEAREERRKKEQRKTKRLRKGAEHQPTPAAIPQEMFRGLKKKKKNSTKGQSEMYWTCTVCARTIATSSREGHEGGAKHHKRDVADKKKRQEEEATLRRPAIVEHHRKLQPQRPGVHSKHTRDGAVCARTMLESAKESNLAGKKHLKQQQETNPLATNSQVSATYWHCTLCNRIMPFSSQVRHNAGAEHCREMVIRDRTHRRPAVGLRRHGVFYCECGKVFVGRVWCRDCDFTADAVRESK